MELRHSPVSKAERFEDTLRTLSGYSDIVVARPARPLDRGLLEEYVVGGFINGGDTGPNGEHPTQALIDMFAIKKAMVPSPASASPSAGTRGCERPGASSDF